MTALSTLTAAQTRIDDGHPQPGDHNCAEQLERLLQESAWHIADDLARRDLERWETWHAEACDSGDECRHYEIRED